MSGRKRAEAGLRVALAGAHGTGKTTLARAFSAEYELVELPTPGRLMAARGLPVNESATVVSQCIAWLIQIGLEEETRRWVSMRSLVDVWAYGALAAERTNATLIDAALFEHLTKATRALVVSRYDVLFYLPPRIPLIADDVRSADPAFQSAVDGKIRGALNTWALDYVEVDVTHIDAVERAKAEVQRAAQRAAARTC